MTLNDVIVKFINEILIKRYGNKEYKGPIVTVWIGISAILSIIWKRHEIFQEDRNDYMVNCLPLTTRTGLNWIIFEVYVLAA